MNSGHVCFNVGVFDKIVRWPKRDDRKLHCLIIQIQDAEEDMHLWRKVG